MKRSLGVLFLSAVILFCSAVPGLYGQAKQPPVAPGHFERKYIVKPLQDAPSRLPQIMRDTAGGLTIPLWSYSVISPVDKNPYSGQMVGRSPFFHGLRTTTIPAYLVPVILRFADTGTVFDPTVTDPCLGAVVETVVGNSPVFQNSNYVMNGVNIGNTQYVDAFERANFWSNVAAAGNSYHTLLGLSTLPPVRVTVPIADGQTAAGFGCGSYGLLDIDWWDNYVQNTLIPSLGGEGVGPTNLPLLLFDSVVMYQNGNPSDCCVLGYHGAYAPSNLLQTYSVTGFDTSGTFGGDISVTTHEVAEWMDDPMGTNPTPAWGNIGQVVGCQANLEVGDPLSGTFFPPVILNGFTYDPQELAFFAWFYRLSPSNGAGGLYSNNGTFTTGAGAVCM
jgi:hypothetical protein